VCVCVCVCVCGVGCGGKVCEECMCLCDGMIVAKLLEGLGGRGGMKVCVCVCVLVCVHFHTSFAHMSYPAEV